MKISIPDLFEPFLEPFIIALHLVKLSYCSSEAPTYRRSEVENYFLVILNASEESLANARFSFKSVIRN